MIMYTYCHMAANSQSKIYSPFPDVCQNRCIETSM